jgi:hypothetical protein
VGSTDKSRKVLHYMIKRAFSFTKSHSHLCSLRSSIQALFRSWRLSRRSQRQSPTKAYESGACRVISYSTQIVTQLFKRQEIMIFFQSIRHELRFSASCDSHRLGSVIALTRPHYSRGIQIPGTRKSGYILATLINLGDFFRPEDLCS